VTVPATLPSDVIDGRAGACQGPVMDTTTMIRESMPLCATLGMRAGRCDRDGAELEVDWEAGLCTSAGVLHGGVLMALADAAGATVAFANLPEGSSGTTTIESKTNLFGAVTGGTVRATARPLHVGSTTIVVETEVRRADDDRLVAKTTQTQLVLRPRA
jgi:1,4-dihydroxy-2-naphthoyl-CoA hydrolase